MAAATAPDGGLQEAGEGDNEGAGEDAMDEDQSPGCSGPFRGSSGGDDDGDDDLTASDDAGDDDAGDDDAGDDDESLYDLYMLYHAALSRVDKVRHRLELACERQDKRIISSELRDALPEMFRLFCRQSAPVVAVAYQTSGDHSKVIWSELCLSEVRLSRLITYFSPPPPLPLFLSLSSSSSSREQQ
jgi:hypothetical protein